ncbi:hypothetical protein C8R43DRAFT_1021434 [Mycena crocata]|nr:hypothetical protein C8R43DRAFT_1021434 [Mycena crocata]
MTLESSCHGGECDLPLVSLKAAPTCFLLWLLLVFLLASRRRPSRKFDRSRKLDGSYCKFCLLLSSLFVLPLNFSRFFSHGYLFMCEEV